MAVQPLEFVWTHEPPFVRHPSPEVLDEFFNWLREQGVAKRSIPIPDHETGQWILFIYQLVDRAALEAWIPSDSGE
ncbi:MAG: hypothetical protein HOE69_04160 [Euryarchaeota archaeon]|nr:hypothetical protein [Euryarchaeota archaeon]